MKRTTLSVLALCGTLALGACGSETADTSSPAASSAPAQDAADTTGAAVGDTVDLAVLAGRSAAAVKAEGTAHMTMSSGSEGQMEADVDYSGDSPAMSMTMTQQGETVEMVYLDKVIYMGGDSFAESTGGKRWIRIDPSGEDMMSQMMGPLLDQMESAMGNPAEQLEAYEGTEATVKSIEGGVTTYTVTLSKEDMAKALESQEEALPGVTEEALRQLPDEGITYDLSLDAEDLPSSMSMQMAGQAVDITYSAWGEPVDIAAPAADEVGTFEMPDLG